MTAANVQDWREVGSSDLTVRARRYIKDRGISTEVARLNNLRSLTADETAALWGRDCHVEALLFPFSKGYAVARLLGRKEGKFRAPPGRGSRIYVPMLPAQFKHSMDDALERAESLRAFQREVVIQSGMRACHRWEPEILDLGSPYIAEPVAKQ